MSKVAIIVTDSGRCGAPEGETIKVSAERAARWAARGWARLPGESPAEESAGGQASSTKSDGASTPALQINKPELIALFKVEIGKDPAEVLEKVTVKNLRAHLEAHFAKAAE